MPTVLRESGYQFIIFTSDHPPPHVHVRREGKLAKVLLNPIEFERTGGFNSGEQSKIVSIIREHQAFLLDEWDKLYPPEENETNE
ncbi:MAG: DUF4160 domain-containing protein [Anaerolineae bacterium]|nr:DUF4160 domain-containing protein [Anaerolineae bacterium]